MVVIVLMKARAHLLQLSVIPSFPIIYILIWDGLEIQTVSIWQTLSALGIFLTAPKLFITFNLNKNL